MLHRKAIEDIQKQEDRRITRILNKMIGIPKMEISTHNSSLGHVLIGSNENAVTAVEFGKDSDECYRNFINRWKGGFLADSRINFNIVDKILKVIETGEHDPTIKILFLEGTYFQRQVWETIQTIEAGNTLSYKDIATKI